MTTPDGHGLEFTDIRHHFTVGGRRVDALTGIDLRIDPGEFVTLAGPSGCGKTTLLRLAAGFMRPSAGSVTSGGRPITGPAPDRGVVFQQPNLFPWFTVRRNVELGPKLRGVGRAERRERAEKYLDLVGLADFAEHRPYELSGGMQQRAQIARVLANEPDVVLMDEPFGALDALTRERLQEELLQIWRETGRTILFITHSVDEAVFLGSRVLVMSPRPGKVVLDRSAVFTDTGGLGRVAPSEIRQLPAFVSLRNEVREAIHGDAPVES
ncbi:ABC transporter ATP-binding protein [Nocardioides yefusunii]|uniref:ABC transporter ATP-binding protein n=1 Tax=Nocardioides yefusunii TaxID=2500546 RepID=A0ABW1QSV0_9ACTN|nr:ABC transporter ATP-binding protein [Nocardioides yefusunii]